MKEDKNVVYSLYGGEVKLVYNDSSHKYKVNGKLIPSVTGILGVLNKPALVGWAANQAAGYIADNLKPGVVLDEIQISELVNGAKGAHRKTATKAADIGTLVHKYAEEYILGLNPEMPVNDNAKEGVKAFLDWYRQHEIIIIESERKIYSRKYNYAGTIDLIAKIDGYRTMLDFKTSNGVWDEYFLQLAAYEVAYNEETGFVSDHRTILHISKDGTGFSAHDSDDHAFHDRGWLHTLGTFRWSKGIGKKAA